MRSTTKLFLRQIRFLIRSGETAGVFSTGKKKGPFRGQRINENATCYCTSRAIKLKTFSALYVLLRHALGWCVANGFLDEALSREVMQNLRTNKELEGTIRKVFHEQQGRRRACLTK